jgi:hypothetical protein
MLSIAEDLSLSLDPAEVFRRCIGGSPDPWQLKCLESFLSGKKLKSIYLTSRQAGKSSCLSVAVLIQSLWITPGGCTLILAPSQRQSAAMMATIAKCYRSLTGGEGRTTADDLESESKLSMTLANGSTILALPGGGDSGDKVRGAVCDCIICDEFVRVSLELINACRPMVATKPRGRLVLLSSAGYSAGWGYDLFRSDDPSWERVKVTADQCPRIDPVWLAAERLEIGESAFQSEYMCAFINPADALFGSAVLEAALSDDISIIRW